MDFIKHIPIIAKVVLIEMTLALPLGRGLRIIIHMLGLSCIGGAIFLQSLVFAGIVQQGYFMAVEQNAAILFVEVGITVIAVVYFVYVYQRLIRSVK